MPSILNPKVLAIPISPIILVFPSTKKNKYTTHRLLAISQKD